MMINANGLSILQLIQSLMAGVGAQGTGTIQINGMPFPTGSTGTEGVYSDMVLDQKWITGMKPLEIYWHWEIFWH